MQEIAKNNGIYRPFHHTDECNTRPFFKVGPGTDASGIPQNVSDLVGIPLKKDASGARR